MGRPSATSSANTKQEPRQPGAEAALSGGVALKEYELRIGGYHLHGLSHATARGRALDQCGKIRITDDKPCDAQRVWRYWSLLHKVDRFVKLGASGDADNQRAQPFVCQQQFDSLVRHVVFDRDCSAPHCRTRTVVIGNVEHRGIRRLRGNLTETATATACACSASLWRIALPNGRCCWL
jgi:hypothetical protein